MGHAQLMELEFESNLCAELSERGWLYEADGSTSAAGWDGMTAYGRAQIIKMHSQLES